MTPEELGRARIAALALAHKAWASVGFAPDSPQAGVLKKAAFDLAEWVRVYGPELERGGPHPLVEDANRMLASIDVEKLAPPKPGGVTIGNVLGNFARDSASVPGGIKKWAIVLGVLLAFWLLSRRR